MAHDATQRIPGVGVDGVVAGVAVVHLAVDRHGAVGADGDAEQQLLQVGPVVLVVAEGDQRRAVGLAGVLAGEGDGGGVLVQLSQADVKLPHGADGQGGEQAGEVGPPQVVQGAADAVVVEQGGLVGPQAEVFGDPAGDPGGD